MFKDKQGQQLTTAVATKKITNRLYNILLELEVYILHLVGYVPSHHVRRLFYRLAGVKIGKGSTIHMLARFYDPRNIVIGKDSIIGEYCVLDGRDKLIIGNHVDIASDVMIYNSKHDIESPEFAPINVSVSIEDYAFIGPRAIILPGVTIAKGAIVAAGAIVTKDVPSFAIVAGIPAQIIGERKNKDPHYTLGRARWFR